MSDAVVGATFAASAATAWGAGVLSARVGMRTVRPGVGTFTSILTGLVLVTALTMLIDPGALARVPREAIWQLALMAALQFPVARFMSYTSIPLVGAPISSAIVASNPLFAAMLAMLLLGEQITTGVAAGILSVVTGLVILVTRGQLKAAVPQTLVQQHGNVALPVAGALAALAAALGYASMQTLGRHVLTGGVTPYAGAVYTLAFGVLYLAAWGLPGLGAAVREHRQGVAYMALAGCCSSLGVLFVYSALSRAPVTLVNPIAAMTPLVVLIGARLLPGVRDQVTRRTLVGVLLVLIGGTLVVVTRG